MTQTKFSRSLAQKPSAASKSMIGKSYYTKANGNGNGLMNITSQAVRGHVSNAKIK